MYKQCVVELFISHLFLMWRVLHELSVLVHWCAADVGHGLSSDLKAGNNLGLSRTYGYAFPPILSGFCKD